MAHNLYGERFYSFRQPAWHKLGHVSDVPMTAREAFEKVGAYDVRLEPVFTQFPDGTYHAVPDKLAITNQDQQVFEVVTNQYRLITPKRFTEVWDESVREPVETLGALGQGEIFFISTKMPSFTLPGDDVVEMYLLACNPMTGMDSASVLVTPIRVVCQNTLTAAKSAQQEVFHIRHRGAVDAQLHVWLEHAYAGARMKADVLREAYTLMARHAVTQAETTRVLQAVYPDVPTIDIHALKDRGMNPREIDTKMIAYERAQAKQDAHRLSVQSLFDGDGKGSELASARGTAFGLYNAVVEYEDYGRKTAKNYRIEEAILWGDRADRKIVAYDECSAILVN